MILMIPIGGLGERFSKENYKNPKPLINVLGKPMINWVIDSFKLAPEDKIVIVYRDELNNYNFKEYLKNEYPKANITFVELKHTTRGAAETVLCGLNNLYKNLDEPVMISDCDTFYGEDVVAMYKSVKGNCIFYFEDKEDKPIFSYISTNESNQVTDIAEKVKISNKANTGVYCFESGRRLKLFCEEILESSFRIKNEFYISDVYRMMITHHEIINSVQVKDFHCLGTPFQLRLFASNNYTKGEKTRFCFDFDNTLVTFPTVKNDYSTVEPIEQMIKFARFLKMIGHTIIIHTARRMKTHKGNVGSVIADIGFVTLETIKKFDIPCDELYFGKPYADFYIDDKAVNVFHEPQKEMGYYINDVDSRSFNSVHSVGDKIEKTSTGPNFEGELHWYNNIPEDIQHLFPSHIISGADERTLVLEKIKGVNLSCLFVNNSMTVGHLNNLLYTLRVVHRSAPVPKETKIYRNYSEKIKSRFKPEMFNYHEFPDYTEVYSRILQDLKDYEEYDRGRRAVIHGDPVFTNILLENDRNFKFIDMRGKLGDENSIYGDAMYDYAKVYQSLLGYDFILQGQKFNHDYMNGLIDVFENFVENEIPPKECTSPMDDIRMITKSLLFSLLPLHNNDKCKKYFDLIKHA